MKKFFNMLFAGVLTVFFSLSSVCSAFAEDTLSLRDELLMKNTIHVLWDMDYKTTTNLDLISLSQMTLVFMSLAHYEVANSYEHPDRFMNIPEEYNAYFPKEQVEKVALNVFGGWIDNNKLREGIFLSSQGYYATPDAILSYPLNFELVTLPSFVEITSKHIDKNGAVILNGTLRRLQTTSDGEEMIVWSAATFMARFSPSEGEWKLDSFVITEEAMG